MNRGKQQVLYNYLPGTTFDYDGGNVICIVTDIDGIEERNINEKRILQEIGRYIYGTSSNPRWSKGRVIGFPDKKDFYSDYNGFIFEEPENVRFDIFPLVFRCIKCGRVYQYESHEKLKARNPGVICNHNCGDNGRLRQIYHVFVHQCGEIEPLSIPYGCNKHGYNHIALDERRSQKARDFRWVCLKCNAEIAPVFKRCVKCSSKGKEDCSMVLTPHRANLTYYPHYIRLVDVGDGISVADIDKKKWIMSEYLGLRSPRSVLTKEERNKMETYERELKNPELPEPVKEYLEEELTKIKSKIEKDNDIGKINTEGIDDTGFTELSEYTFVLNKLKNENISQRAERLRKERPGSEGILLAAEDAVKKFGFEDIHLIEEFPVITAVFGYTRVSFEPVDNRNGRNIETVIKAFPRRRDGRVPVYVDRGGTEALLFRLDPLAVTEWLKGNGLSVNLYNSDKAKLKMHYLQNIANIDRYAMLNEEDEVTYYVFNLLHSLSHCFIGAASLISGFEKMGMAEYIFPRELSFVIYSNKTVFTIGGFHTLFEQSLAELMEKCLDPELRLCVYDPVCISKGGSCHGCMHLPEITCSYFNRQLGRVFLYGGELNGRKIKGFWENLKGAFRR
ncbi:hypothetical protein JOC37_000689 [Desulfohalotomaculum tongense]|uniref:hypothetical protein n=1 Tax=Desulforadius tongensis TaxID=1216062 RepID=UPI00195AE8F1|nr:hypothetical protein [Desulforadius tongensis]MBM7854316.1 hypothetical protein [Desulforadius tongensis]